MNCYPRGNTDRNTHLSIYLDCSPEEEAKVSALEEWQISFTLKDSREEGKHVEKSACSSRQLVAV